MSFQQKTLAKAVTPEERSDAIVVSFGHEWHRHILAADFSLVLRKRIPNDSAQFNWIYMHVNSPVGAICARAAINTINRISTSDAVEKQQEISLTERAIRAYIGSSDFIGAYHIESIEPATAPLSTALINEHLVYFPPQSFFVLSVQGKEVIDKLASFTKKSKKLSGEGC